MISYEAEGVKFPHIKKRETSNWIRLVAATYGKKVGEIGYLFVNDEKILEVNNEYLGHDYYTDIITFVRLLVATSISRSIPSLPMPTSTDVPTMKSSTVSSFTASSTSVASTTKGQVSARRWKLPRTKH